MKVEKTISVKGTITPDGRGLSFHHGDHISMLLASKVGEDVDIDITFGRVKRTLAMNRYLWGVCYVFIKNEMRNKFGEEVTLDEIHAHNLQKIQGVSIEYATVNGENVLVIKDVKSSKMTIEQFTVLLTSLKDWYAIHKDIIIPEMEGDATINDYLK